MNTNHKSTLPPGLCWRTDCISSYQPQHGEGDGPKPGVKKAPPNGKAAPNEAAPGQVTPKAPGNPMQGCYSQWPLLLLMLVAFWFLLLRPQMKQEKAVKRLQAALKKGDDIVTNSGLHGVVEQIDEHTVTIKADLEGKVRLTFDRSAITRRPGADGAAETDAAKKAPKT